MKCPKCFSDNPETQKFCGDCGTALEAGIIPTMTVATPREELSTGATFAGRYQIIEELGKGGMGRVYKVLDKEANEKIALKLIKPEIASDKKTIERFRNELTTARKISQKNVCRMYDLNKERGSHYITMEYVSGGDLKKFIRRSKQLTIATTISIAKQICAGLSEAHELGIVHRDLKPNNIMIDDRGDVRIMDFGIARSLKTKSMTGPGVMIGTPEYMAPEQVDGQEVDQRTDIYAFGIILYEMLTGRLPFAGDNPFAVGIKQKSEIPEAPQKYNASIPEKFSRLILRCLEKKSEDRYQTVGELCSDLLLIEASVPTSERKSPERKPSTSKEITVTIGLKKLLWPISAAAVLILISVFVWKVLARKDVIPPVEGKPSVAILYFKNNTGDAGLDHWRNALADLLITDLAQSKFIQVLSEDKLFKILGDLDQLDAKNFSSDVIKEVASRGQVNHVLVGGYTRAGDIFRLNVTLQNAADGEVIGSESVEGGGEQSFYSMVDEVTRRIKARFALSRNQLSSDIDRRVQDITTNNPEALKFYIEGRRLHLDSDYRASIQVMENAVSIDPEFAMAYRSLAVSYGNRLMFSERARYIQKAMELSERLPVRERYQIMGDYYSKSEKTYDKAIEAFVKLLEIYPETLNALSNLGVIYRNIDEEEKAAEYYQKAIEGGDRSVVVYTNLAGCFQAMGQFDKSERLLNSYIETISDNPVVRNSLSTHYIYQGDLDMALAEADKAFLLNPSFATCYLHRGNSYRFQGDYDKAKLEFQKAMQSTEMITKILGGVNLAYMYFEQGKFRDAFDLVNREFEIVKLSGQDFMISRFYIGFAKFYLQDGQPQEALRNAERAYAIAEQIDNLELLREALYQKGLALLDLGDVSEAEDTATQLMRVIESGVNRKIIHLYFHLTGEIDLRKGRHPSAVDAVHKALALLENGPLAFDANYIKTLALAYYQSGELRKALSEYKRITSLTTGREDQGAVFAKSFYMIGRIYEQQGVRAKAVENYEKFLALWQDADPGMAEAEDAGNRLAGLRRPQNF